MKINQLTIESFRGFNERKEFNFDNAHLIVLYGPNGHGKTSFFDAIEWVLTGKINRYDDPSDERNRSKFVGNTFSSKPPYVKMVLDDENKKIAITRKGIKDDSKTDYGKTTLFIEIKDEVCYFGLLAQEYLNGLIINKEWLGKINSENLNNIFNLTHYSSQEKMSHYLRGAKEGERYDALSTILGTDHFNVYKSKFKDAQNKFKNDVRDIDEILINCNAKKKTLKLDIEELKVKLEQYNYSFINTEELLSTFNYLFNKELDVNLNVDIILQEINKTNSELFNEKVNWQEEYQKIKILKKDLNKYKQSYENRLINSNRVKLIENVQRLDKKLLDFSWMKTNLGEYTAGKKDYDEKVNKKQEIQHSINLTGNLIKALEAFISEANLSLKNAEETYNFQEFKIIIKNRLNKLNQEEILLNLLNITEENIKQINEKRKALDEANQVINENKKWLNSLENVDEKYSTLLRYVVEYASLTENIKNCPVCGNEGVSSEYIINYVKTAQKEVNVDIPLASQKVNNSLTKYEDIKKELDVAERNYIDNNKLIKLELEKVTETILEEKQKLTILYQSINNLTKTIEIIEENHEKFERLINNYSLEIKNLSEVLEEELFEVQSELNSIKLIDDTLIDEFYNEEYFKGLKTEIENSNIFIRNYRSLMAEVNCQEIEPNTVGVLINNMVLIFKGAEEKFDEKTKVLSNLISCMDNLKTQQILKEKIKKYEEVKEKIIKLIEQKNSIEEKINVLDEAIQSVPFAIEKLNEKSIKQLFSLIQKVYSKLNSHPIFNKVDFKAEKRYGTFKLLLNVLSNDNFEANPAYIYSAAQVNTIALSIFLSMAIKQSWSNLDIIALDDPIQSMDSLNSIAFIDLLRRLTDQNGYNKQLIISTHDSSFFELIHKKFQLFDVGIIQFSGYGENGPIFGELVGTKEKNERLINFSKGKALINFNEIIMAIE